MSNAGFTLTNSAAFPGRCKPSCCAILTAILVHIGVVSNHKDEAGNGQEHRMTRAWTVDIVFGSSAIVAQVYLVTGADRNRNNVISSSYRREATAMIAQKSNGDWSK